MRSEDFHPEAETSNSNTMPDSEDSEEETSYEDPPVTSWSELSIIEHVGLNSVKMSEKDLQTAFSQISLAFRCDQYTLKQRLQSEEHARNLAEENIELELSRGRETLESLKALCLDSRRRSLLQRLELSLDILGGTVERISNTAEVLGAVHQEARVSRAVELMVAHVESLKRHHDRNVAELEKTKKILQQQEQLNSCRHKILLRTFTDAEEREKKWKASNDCALRRRISASVISSQTQERRHQDLRTRISSCSEVSKEASCSVDDGQLDPDPPEGPDSDLPPPPNPEISSSEQVTPIKAQNKNPSLDALRQKHKVKAASSSTGKVAKIHTQNSVATSGSSCKKRRLTLRVHRCRGVRICISLLVLLCVIVLIYYIWKLYDGELEP